MKAWRLGGLGGTLSISAIRTEHMGHFSRYYLKPPQFRQDLGDSSIAEYRLLELCALGPRIQVASCADEVTEMRRRQSL
jgi:hypothetical protein